MGRTTIAQGKWRSSIRRSTLAAFIAFSASFAGVAAAECFGYYCSGPIETMTISDDAVYIRLVGGTAGLNSCTPYSGGYMVLYKTHANYASLYATLVAAYMAKESVSLRPQESGTSCPILYIMVP